MGNKRRVKKMGVTTLVKPIPKTQIGMNKEQKAILRSYVGKAPILPINLNEVREWEKYEKN